MRNRCLGVFLIFLAFPFVVLSIIELTFVHNLTNSGFYKSLLKNSDTYNRTSTMITDSVKSTDDNLITEMAKKIDATWLKQNVETNLDEFFRFANGRSKSPDLNLDLTKLKSGLKPSAQISQQTISYIPDKLSIDSYKTFLEQFQKELQKDSQGLDQKATQDELNNVSNQISQADNASAQYQNNLNNIRRAFLYKTISTVVIYFFTLLILFFIGFAAKDDLRAIFRWEGNALIYPSGFMAIGFYVMSLGKSACIRAISNIQASDETLSLLKDVCQEAIKSISSSGLKISLAIFIIAVLAIITSYIIPKKDKGSPVSSTPQS